LSRTDRTRVLVYSHDTYGLGHLRRCLLIADRIAALEEEPDVLVVTGSPRAQSFRLVAGVDTVKLPAATKSAEGGYHSRNLRLDFDELVALRSHLLQAAGRAFLPDLLLVDHAPTGMAGELLPLLHEAHGWLHRPRLVLGLRDIVDEAQRVERAWDRDDVWDALAIYDRILVYGDNQVRTTADELELDERLPGRIRHVGYLGRPRPSPTRTERRGPPTIVVTAGGGGDGFALLDAYATFLESLRGPAPFRSIIVTGPLLSPRWRATIAGRLVTTRHDVAVVEFTERMEHVIADAAGVISMAGYNTVVEILSAGVPALLAPRRSPRLEQALRAERLAPHADLEVCPTGTPDPELLGRFIRRALEAPPRKRTDLRLDGLDTTAGELRDLLAPATPRIREKEVRLAASRG
jgi:predicted glycosyltransferase